MKPDARRCAVGMACALALGSGLCQSGDLPGCRPRPASAPSPARPIPAGVSQSVACGDVTVTVGTPPSAAPASAGSAAAKPDRAASPSAAGDELRRLGLYGAGGLLALAVVLLLAAFVMAHLRHGIAVNRDSIRFGGAGRGWEVSPALAALVASAVVAAMAMVLSMAALDTGADAPKADGATSRQKSG